MLTNNPKINSLKYDDAVSRLMEGKNISATEARRIISEMSFADYHRLIEATADIVPPSGRVISPQQQAAQDQPAPVAGQAPATPGQPIQNIKPGTQPAPNTPPVAGQAIQQQAQQLMPPGSQVPVIPGQPIQPGQQQTEEEQMLQRLRELAGIGEDCSGGATGAGSVAVGATAMGGMKRRTPPVEESPSLEHPVAGRKTVVGATGPQASAVHKLSANNAVRGAPTPFRKNNGLKK